MFLSAILLLVMYLISVPILFSIRKNKPWFNVTLMQGLFWFHFLFAAVYYIMVMNAASDSVGYYERAYGYYQDGWLNIYTTGTKFIDFVAYPFVRFLGFSYESMMLLFAWMGYWGFVYFYIFFKENVQYNHKWLTSLYYGETSLAIPLITLFIFLPNMHYWTASLGKGSIIFLGIGMVMYGLSKMSSRKGAMILGLLIVYHVRPHVFLFMTIGIIVGLFTGRQKVPFYQKMLVFAGTAIALALMYDKIIAFAGLNSDNLLESFDKFSTARSGELAKANSGVDISQYPVILKLFTFWFRPLFVDAPGLAGLIVSFENVIYIFFACKLFQRGFINYLRTGSALVKAGMVMFLATSFALSATLSNMGIIVRQKSMVMYFFLFIILTFLDYKKNEQKAKQKRILKQQEEEHLGLSDKVQSPTVIQ